MIVLTSRQTCLWIHRYTGLLIVVFLIIAGLTGSLLAFHEQLDDWFNRDLAYIQASEKPQIAIATLHDEVIETYPDYKFSSMPTTIEAERSAVFVVDREQSKQTSLKAKSSFQEVYLNPQTGKIIGTRDREQWAWHNTMYKVFWLHRELLLGDIGKLILGIVSLIWTINCFIGFYLTLPRKSSALKAKRVDNKFGQANNKKRTSLLKRWLPAWKIRTKTNTFKLNYDLHHAFGLWLWLILFVIAWSSVGFNLKSVYQPVMQVVVGLESKEDNLAKAKTETKLENIRDAQTKQQSTSSSTLTTDANKITKANSIAYLSEQAEIAAQKDGVEIEKLLGMRWIAEDNQWQMRFTTTKDIGKKGGASSITVDAGTGKVEKVKFGYNSSFASKTDQWLATLHMGHISLAKSEQLGHLLYQLLLVLIGLAVTTLSASGAYLWIKGRQQRLRTKQKALLKLNHNQSKLQPEPKNSPLCNDQL